MAAFLFLALQMAAAGECLKYEPEVVTLRGTIERQTFPGPPGYESIKDGDRKETYWFLRLDRPVCTVAATYENRAYAGVKVVQLVFPYPRREDGTDSAYVKYRPLFGHHVAAKGTLFGQITGHHFSRVLLSVSDLADDPVAPPPATAKE